MMFDKTKYINAHTHRQPGRDTIAVVNIEAAAIPEFEKTKYYSVGLHPWYIPEKGIGKLLQKIELAARQEEVVAIGECGLDKLSSVPMELQQFVFEKQVEIAEKVHKPLIIHCVKSFNELIQVKNHTRSEVEWIIHGYNSNLQIADMLIRHEMYFSFGSALLNANSNAYKVLPQLEDELYLLETDDKENDIKAIYDAAVAITGMDEDILKLSMSTNFINIFKI